MGVLKSIAIKIKGHDCEKMVKRIGNEISLTLPTIDTGLAKLNIGLFSNKIMELVRASPIAVALDESQYLICKILPNSKDPDLIKCEKIYLQIILALTQLGSIYERIKLNPDPKVRRELSNWIEYCQSLNNHAINVTSPGSSGKGLGEHTLEEIMEFQNLTDSEMSEALNAFNRTR